MTKCSFIATTVDWPWTILSPLPIYRLLCYYHLDIIPVIPVRFAIQTNLPITLLLSSENNEIFRIQRQNEWILQIDRKMRASMKLTFQCYLDGYVLHMVSRAQLGWLLLVQPLAFLRILDGHLSHLVFRRIFNFKIWSRRHRG